MQLLQRKKKKREEEKNLSHKKIVFHSHITPAIEQQWLLNTTLILQVNRLLKISKWQLWFEDSPHWLSNSFLMT